MFKLGLVGVALAAGGAIAAGIPSGDAVRGSQLFQTQQCVACHSVNGRGGHSAPDLGKRIDRDYTPTAMASLMWNHAPDMWVGIQAKGIERPSLTPEQSADLFAYFVAAHYFEAPGDAARGKRAFAARHCAECHGTTTSSYPGAPPVAKWESLADPSLLADQMWNHGPRMREAFAQKKLEWSQLTGQELSDMLVYLQNLPETRGVPRVFELTASDSGQSLFVSKGCAGCHTGANALETKLRNQSLTDIAADMWNHQPNMKNPPPTLTPDEMRRILGYVWEREYFQGSGDAARGKKVFAQKSCASCHNQPGSGAPSLARGKDAYSDVSMVSALWQHGPAMLQSMKQKSISWPRFDAQQMADLIAYLNSL
ncbi:MAG TPA: c-type cytochrome [Bryobacteraceae bacterium]|nr:c-type cytochrome [Bryobacteraceae bacterium]